jgi:hypothetical protein
MYLITMLNYTEHYGLLTGNGRYFHGRDDDSSSSPSPKYKTSNRPRLFSPYSLYVIMFSTPMMASQDTETVFFVGWDLSPLRSFLQVP